MKSRKKKLLFLAILALIFLTACSSIVNRDGEKIWMSETEMSELHKKEQKLALYIINHYEDVQKIEFTKISRKPFGQARYAALLVNDKIKIYTDLDDSYGNYYLSDNPEKDSLKAKEKPTNLQSLDSITVIYYTGK